MADVAVVVGDASIRVAPAAAGELGQVAAILDDASAWLESRGLGHWPRPFPVEWLRDAASDATCYLAWDGTTAAGTFTLQRTDVLFWGERPDEPSGAALYLHKLAVRRAYRGLGRALVDLAEAMAAEAGARCLRLDCMAKNGAIRAYYEDLGFRHRGDIDVPGLAWRASLYEKALGNHPASRGRAPA